MIVENVSLEVLNMLGRRVAVLVNNRVEAGIREIIFDASTLASGVNIYLLNAESSTI